MRVHVEPGESSVRVKVNGAEVGIARPNAEVTETLRAGDVMELEAFDEADDHPREARDGDGGTGENQTNTENTQSEQSQG